MTDSTASDPYEGLAPEPVLPAQFFAAGDRATGELRLMEAVLMDAIGVWERRARKARNAQRQREQDRQWFASDDMSWPYSFVNVCHYLGIDPDALRAHLARVEHSGARVARYYHITAHARRSRIAA
jgi:hypothetical protein